MSTTAMPDAGQDRGPQRREMRRATSWDGLIRLPDGAEIPCVVKDVSRSGARLCVPAALAIAKTFLLKIEARGFAFSVAVVWRSGDFVGIRIEKIARLKARADAARSTP